MELFTLDALASATRAAGVNFHECLRRESLSVGMYLLPAGAIDTQVPHREDEIYVVVKGDGWIEADGADRRVGPGSVIFVPARADHRFHDIREDLELLVVFAPSYSGRGG